MIDRLRRFADLAGLDRRARWALVVAMGVLVSAIEAVGALLVYLLLSLVTGLESVRLPLVGDVRGLFAGLDDQEFLVVMSAAIAAFFLVRAFVLLGQRYVEARVTENAGVRLASRLATGYLAMPYAFHLNRNSAELVRNAYVTTRNLVREAFQPAVKIVSQGLVATGLVVALLITAPAASALAVGVLGTCGYLLLRLVYSRVKRLGRQAQDDSKTALQAMQQSLAGLRDIKLLGRERFFRGEFNRAQARYARTKYVVAVLRDIPAVGLETILVLFIAGLFVQRMLAEDTALGAVPLLGMFGYAAMRLKPSMNQIVQGVSSLRYAWAGIDDLYEDVRILEARDSAPDDPEPEPLLFDHEVRLASVSFRYENADREAVRDVDLVLHHGESVGIVGPTGGGKTTLLDLVLGLIAPTSGSVLVDGEDIRGRERAWQQNLGMVPQVLFLTDDTLRRNIALGERDSAIDEARLTQAVELAQLGPVVEDLQRGLDTRVGERGVRLSGGQRQRVAIARALYRRPKMLVFDEGTSALDTVTESLFLEALDRLRGDMTLVMVAHRLATVRACDRIVLMADGRVEAAGTYAELVATSEHFRELAG